MAEFARGRAGSAVRTCSRTCTCSVLAYIHDAAQLSPKRELQGPTGAQKLYRVIGSTRDLCQALL